MLITIRCSHGHSCAGIGQKEYQNFDGNEAVTTIL